MGVRKRLIGNREVNDDIGTVEQFAQLHSKLRIGATGQLETLGGLYRLTDRGPHAPGGTGNSDSYRISHDRQLTRAVDRGPSRKPGAPLALYVWPVSSTRMFLGVTRALIGIGSWLAPERTARLFGIDPERSDRFVTRLFGARELALAAALLGAPPSAVAPAAAVGVAIDAADAAAGFDERRRGNLSTQATILGPVGALLFVALGVLVARQAPAAVEKA